MCPKDVVFFRYHVMGVKHEEMYLDCYTFITRNGALTFTSLNPMQTCSWIVGSCICFLSLVHLKSPDGVLCYESSHIVSSFTNFFVPYLVNSFNLPLSINLSSSLVICTWLSKSYYICPFLQYLVKPDFPCTQNLLYILEWTEDMSCFLSNGAFTVKCLQEQTYLPRSPMIPLCIEGQLKSRIDLNKSFKLLCNSRLLNYIGINTSNKIPRCIVFEMPAL